LLSAISADVIIAMGLPSICRNCWQQWFCCMYKNCHFVKEIAAKGGLWTRWVLAVI
jgi:hypothetical protein